MGEAARRAYHRRSTPAQRLRDGLSLSDAVQRAVLARAGIVLDGTEETARRAARVLRQAGE